MFGVLYFCSDLVIIVGIHQNLMRAKWGRLCLVKDDSILVLNKCRTPEVGDEKYWMTKCDEYHIF